MAFKMKYTKGSFPFKPSPNKFLGGVGKAIGRVVGGKRRRGGGKPGGSAIEAARGAMSGVGSGIGALMGGPSGGGGMMGGVFGMGPNLPSKMLKGGGRAPGKFPGFGALGAGPRGAAALVKKDKNK